MIRALMSPAPVAAVGEGWFEDLYRSSRADIHAYVASVVRDAAAAEDVTALAFERAYRRRALLDPGRGSARAWLFAIARNAALDELRRRKRTTSLLVDLPAEDLAFEDEDLRIRRDAVRAGLGQLDPRERELILLKFHGQLSNAELAKVLGCSVSNAGTRLCRALGRLREVCDAPV
jgi:RNA polymerase sigma-70 factor (ECF subfamily)